MEQVEINIPDKPMSDSSLHQGYDSEFSQDVGGTEWIGNKAVKRPSSSFTGGMDAPRKKAKNGNANVVHTPLSILNQLLPGLSYHIEGVEGPPHKPLYTVSVEVNELKYEGSGVGKQAAKQSAAETVLVNMFPAALAKHCISPQSTTTPSPPPITSFSVERQERLIKKAEEALTGKTNPLAAVNEILQGIKFECLSTNSGPFGKFVYGFTIEGEVYKGSGNSKKAAKCAAARAYLSYKFGGSTLLSPPSPAGLDTQSKPSGFPTLLPHTADAIAEMVLNKFAEVSKECEDYSRRKVLAGLVMTRKADLSDPVVICLATGTKTIGGEYMSVSGSALNDCHAEVASRRAFLKFLYKELKAVAKDGKADSSIFELNPDKKGYRLKEGVKFHLYINTAPCGDARIFSPHESNEESAGDRHPNRQSRGQLRTKIESGEGTIPVRPNQVQTWDAVIQGQRLLTMSCSDKVLKWNVLGLQGCLLTHFIPPIYLSSICIGSLFNQPHLYRALCGRVEHFLGRLPIAFVLNKPHANKTTSPEPRIPAKAPNHSINWIIDEPEVEVVNATTGRCVNGEASRLCKKSLMADLLSLVSHDLASTTGLSSSNCPHNYYDLKQMALPYNDAKAALFESFLHAKIGSWVKKPIEQDQFELVSDGA